MSAAKKRARSRMISFRADEDLVEALKELEATVTVARGTMHRSGKRSMAIRAAVLEKVARLRGPS